MTCSTILGEAEVRGELAPDQAFATFAGEVHQADRANLVQRGVGARLRDRRREGWLLRQIEPEQGLEGHVVEEQVPPLHIDVHPVDRAMRRRIGLPGPRLCLRGWRSCRERPGQRMRRRWPSGGEWPR